MILRKGVSLRPKRLNLIFFLLLMIIVSSSERITSRGEVSKTLYKLTFLYWDPNVNDKNALSEIYATNVVKIMNRHCRNNK